VASYYHQRRLHRRWAVALRDVIAAIGYLCRTGCQWRALPAHFPASSAVYYYFRRWQQDSTWQRLNTALNQADCVREGRAPDPAVLCVDSQIIKLLPGIFEERGIDGGKLVNGRNRHIAVDTGGRIWCAHVTAANVADSRGGVGLLDALPMSQLAVVLTDGGYRGEFAEHIKARHVRFEVAARPPTERGFVPLAQRWVIEHTFAWACFYRRLIHDYEFTPASHCAWLLIANCAICISRLAADATKS
jgi:transposase